MPQYVVANKRHARVGKDGVVAFHEVGEFIEPTDAELAAFPDRFAKVPEPINRQVDQEDGQGPTRTTRQSGNRLT